MALTEDQISDIRQLALEGTRHEVLAELFHVSISRIRQLTVQPPDPEELEWARERLERLEQARIENEPIFAGFSGDAALEIADLFDCPCDGGDAYVDGRGVPRS